MKSRKLVKILGASGLAIMMGIGTLCGVLISPMNTTHANTSAGALTPQQKLMSGEDLGLDPENDPVIFTTDYGLQIKSHNVGEVHITTTSPSGSVTVSSTSWNYISAGGYNWIIIGSYSASSYTISAIKGDEYPGNKPDGTDAGNAIENANGNGLLKVNNFTVPAFSNAKVGYNGEIPFGCVLCLCAGNIAKKVFNGSKQSGNNYSGSYLQDYIDNTVYGSTSTLSTALQGLKIVPQDLTTLYYNSAKSTINNAYVFPLAGINNTESFYVGSYLDSNAKCDIDQYWWLRSGHASKSDCAYFVTTNGGISYDINSYGVTYYDTGVRPAFVLQLYSV